MLYAYISVKKPQRNLVTDLQDALAGVTGLGSTTTLSTLLEREGRYDFNLTWYDIGGDQRTRVRSVQVVFWGEHPGDELREMEPDAYTDREISYECWLQGDELLGSQIESAFEKQYGVKGSALGPSTCYSYFGGWSMPVLLKRSVQL